MAYIKIINNIQIIKEKHQIIIKKDGMQIINPSEELILADGWEIYTTPVVEEIPHKPSERELLNELIKQDFNNRTTTNNEDALHYMVLVYPYEHYIGKDLKSGQLVTYLDRIYRVRQDIPIVLDYQHPDINTASLYEVIEKEHEGTLEDPIPYLPPMEIFEGKYYTQNDILYICIRNSETTLTHNLEDLLNTFVNKI